MGGPDFMGWTTVDFTTQEGTYFHVDDFSGLGGGSFGGLASLEGGQSLWCGARPGAPLCYYAALPGYGHDWDQQFISIPFAVSGDVTVSFLARFDSEVGYDETSLEYFTKSGRWEALAQFDEGASFPGFADSLVSETIPADSLDTVAQIRFRFTSDGSWDDEDGLHDSDGALIIDSLVVSDDGGIVDYQDFEAETVGDLVTADGHWLSGVPAGFSDYAWLFDGSTVLQEDTVNNSYLWGFFLASPDDYGCGGHPEQAAVPLARAGKTIHNAAVSPVIDITSLLSGGALPESLGVFVEFDVYRDLSGSYVFYEVHVRSLVGGCWGNWVVAGGLTGGHGEWARDTYDIATAIEPGATHVQLALCVRDVGGLSCHSHSPLFDNVSLFASSVTPIVVTNTNDSGYGSLRQAIEFANAFHGASVIVFDIPGPGPHTISPLSPLQRLIERAVIDATTQPGYAGSPVVELDLSGTWDNLDVSNAVYGLAVYGLGPSLHLRDNAIAQRNYIGVDAAGVVVGGGDVGVDVFGSSVLVGGSVADANVIAGFTEAGLRVNVPSVGVEIRGNSFRSNGGLAIDLEDWPSGFGPTPNDIDDADNGGNQAQNFPVLTGAVHATSTIMGSLNSEPNTSYVLDFYENTSCGPLGRGEGETYLGSTIVQTDGQGDASFEAVVSPFSPDAVLAATATGPDGTSEFSTCMAESVITGVPDLPPLPDRYALLQNHPNPFNPATTIRYDVPPPGATVSLRVYDVRGRLVEVLREGFVGPGRHAATWDGTNRLGEHVGSGVYFYRLETPVSTHTRKMVLLE